MTCLCSESSVDCHSCSGHLVYFILLAQLHVGEIALISFILLLKLVALEFAEANQFGY